MGRSAKASATGRKDGGFSIAELVIAMIVVMVLSAMAIPSLMRSYRYYQLNTAATQAAGVIKLARFEAIRRNRKVSFRLAAQGSNWILWADTNGDGNADSTENQYLLSGTVLPVSSGTAPDSSPITTALGGTLTAMPAGIAAVEFDARGSVTTVPPSTYIIYLGSATQPEFGFRAVVLLQSGITQLWTAPNNGVWKQMG